MRIVNDGYESVVKVRKNNRIILRNDVDKFKFINFINKCFNKVGNNHIYLDNCDVTSDYIFIDLMDNYSIGKHLKYNKGSLLYEYINYYLMNNDDENKKLFQELFNYFESLKEKVNCSFIEFDYNENIEKLFSSFVKVNINDMDNYEEIFNGLLKVFINKYIDCKVFLLYNSEVLNINLIYDNLFVIDVCNNFDVSKSNILFVNDCICEFNFDCVLEYIYDNYPIEFNNKIIFNKLDEYLVYYFPHKKLKVNDFDILIIAKLLSKIYGYEHELCLNNVKISNNIKSFLTNF